MHCRRGLFVCGVDGQGKRHWICDCVDLAIRKSLSGFIGSVLYSSTVCKQAEHVNLFLLHALGRNIYLFWLFAEEGILFQDVTILTAFTFLSKNVLFPPSSNAVITVIKRGYISRNWRQSYQCQKDMYFHIQILFPAFS